MQIFGHDRRPRWPTSNAISPPPRVLVKKKTRGFSDNRDNVTANSPYGASSRMSLAWSLPSSEDLTRVWDDIFYTEPAPAWGEVPLNDLRSSAALSEQSTLAENASEGKDVERKDEDTTGFNTPRHQSVIAGNAGPDTEGPANSRTLTGFKLVTVVLSLLLTILCVALDNTIISTAVPKITDTFKTIDDIAWYGTAYFLCTCSFQLLYAKFYLFFNVKWVFLTALGFFEIGSVVCAIAPTSHVFIAGRGIAGFGAAGLFSGATAIVVIVAPLDKRPMIAGLIGAMFGICSILGPLVGGVLSDKSTWRWCFWINLPLGGVAVVGIIFLVNIKGNLRQLEGTLMQRIKRFDPLGNLFFVGAILSLLFALHWAGNGMNWGNARIITLFTLVGVFLAAFVGLQIWQKQENVTIPARVIKLRSIAFGAFFAFCLGGVIFLMVYHLALWFQVVRGASPIMSAVRSLPMILSQLFGTILAGILTTKIGYYMPFVWASTILMPVGCGLIHTFSVNTVPGEWIGYLLILGLGLGFGFQQPTVACQAALPKEDIPIGSAIVFSSQFLGGTVFLAVGQHQFNEALRTKAAGLNIPHINPSNVADIGATTVRQLLPPQFVQEFLIAYNSSLRAAFEIAMIISCLAIIGAAGMEWLSVRKKPPTLAETT